MRLKVDIIVVAGGGLRSSGGQGRDQDDSHRYVARIDPVGAGLVESLASPGGNVTGLYRAFPEN